LAADSSIGEIRVVDVEIEVARIGLDFRSERCVDGDATIGQPGDGSLDREDDRPDFSGRAPVDVRARGIEDVADFNMVTKLPEFGEEVEVDHAGAIVVARGRHLVRTVEVG
jgi:hypothetical protein